MSSRNMQAVSMTDYVTSTTCCRVLNTNDSSGTSDAVLYGLGQVMAERNHEALNLIQLDEDAFTIHKQTCANNYTER